MDLPLADLGPLPVDDLVAVLPAADDELWERFTMRRHMLGHAETKTIPVIWADKVVGFDAPVVFEPDYASEPLRAAAKACAEQLVARIGGGTITRLMLVDLPAGAEVVPHRDTAPIITDPHRCHVPVLTNEAVSFVIDGIDHHLAAGRAYEMDNTREHSVANRGATRRVHLICDVMPQRGA